jgi:hypothetical protein
VVDVDRRDRVVLAELVKQDYGVDAAGEADGDLSARRLP